MATQDASGQWIHTAGKIFALVTPTVTIDTAIYAAGDNVGGKLTLPNALRSGVGTGRLQSITLLDRANQKPALDIFLFESDPTVATITNNAAFVFSTDDLKVLCRIPVVAGDWVTTNSKATATLRSLMATVSGAGTSLYAALVLTSGTPTFVAATDIQVRFGFELD